LEDVQHHLPDELFRLLRNLLDEVVLTGYQHALTHVLDNALDEELAVLCEASSGQLVLNDLGLVFDADLNSLSQFRQNTLGNC
jgi:hypothetical protein